jgi:hypothetical protein
MRAVLFHAIIPDGAQPLSMYRLFVNDARQLSLPSGVDRLSENVWLVPVPTHQLFLTKLLTLAKQRAAACRSLEVDAAQAWTTHP